MFVRKTIYGAAVGTAIIIFIFGRIAAADEAYFVVNGLIRFERKYRTTRDGIEVFRRIFVARHDASGTVAVIRAVQTDYKLTAFAERFGYIGMQFDRSSLLRTERRMLHKALQSICIPLPIAFHRAQRRCTPWGRPPCP